MMKTVLVVAVVALFSAVSATSECSTYENTAVTYFTDCACYACAYTGPGCTACTNGSDTCYTDGASCQPLDQQP